MSEVALVVIAKAPVAGRAKTRLCPPCSPSEAAALAEASLADTLEAIVAAPARRRIVSLEGAAGPWLPAGFEVVAQRGRGLGERLAGAIADAGEPALVVGMDTPQLTPAMLAGAAALLTDADAVLGPATDGGYWAIGLREASAAAFDGVPMSTAGTCAAQGRRLRELGLDVAELPTLRDVDTIADALAVAKLVPGSRFAAAVRGAGVGAAAA